MGRSVGGALMEGVGRALMRREDIEREDSLLAREDARQNELMNRQDARQNELLSRQEAREDLVAQREAAIQRAREIRQEFMRAQEREGDQAFQRELLDTQLGAQRELAGDQAGLQRDRWSREDRAALEEQATNQLAALDGRVQDLQDMLLKGEVLGEQGEVERQIREAEDQKLAVRSRLVDRLYEMGDPRYKDMAADERLYAAGYSKDQVARMARLAQNASGTEEAPPPAATDSEIASRTRQTDPARVSRYGLTDADRQVLGLPADAGQAPLTEQAMRAPESPPPIRDMSQAGRGRRIPTTTGRGGAQVTDVGEVLSDLFRTREPVGERRTAPGRGAPKPQQDPEAQAAKNVLSAMRNGFVIDTMKDLETMRKMTPSQLRAIGFTEDEIRRAKKQPPHRRP